MKDRFNFNLNEDDGLLTIKGDIFYAQENGGASWTVRPIDGNRFMVVSEDAAAKMAKAQTGIARCNIDVFADFIFGLTHRQWSGCVSVDTGVGIKRLFFSDGNLCFASSTLIDHRLGEVIYRQGVISLDDLTENTVKVTRTRKFGQVLLAGGLFTTVDLWEALKAQVLEIVRCVFLFPSVYFEIEPGKGLAPTEVVFADGTAALVDDAFSFGCMFREFLQRVDPNSSIKLNNERLNAKEFVEGTFFGDLLNLIHEDPKVESVINGSKLLDINTYVAIMTLVNEGVCEVDQVVPVKPDLPDCASSLKSLFDAYSVLIRQVRVAFQTEDIDFPINDLKAFCLALNPVGFVSLYLNEQGEVHRESVLNVYSQCANTPARVDYFTMQLESLIQFALQVSSDLLPFDVAKAVKSKFKDMRV